MIDFGNLEQIEEEIKILCKKRAEILYQEGIEEPFLVYDNSEDKLNDNVWVLIPEEDYDLIKLVFDNMKMSEEERSRYNSWLSEYRENSCITKCPNTDTPRCCCVCPDKFDCEDILCRCGDLDKVNEIKICVRRGMFNERG